MARKTPKQKIPKRLLKARRSEVHDVKRRHEIAFHEAGHAVIAVILGWGLRWVEIRHSDLSDGSSRVGATDLDDVNIEDIAGKGEMAVRPILIQTLAGMIVEAWVNPGMVSHEYQTGTTDWGAGLYFAGLAVCELAKTTSGRLEFTKEEFERRLPQILAMMESARDEAIQLAEKHRPAITEVASMLERKGRLTGEEVRAIVEAKR